MNLPTKQDKPIPPPRIQYVKVQNFRALRDVELKNLSPLTVLVGPNGSGKSTVFDVFAFLAECFELGLRRAWDKRGRAKELRTRKSRPAAEIPKSGCNCRRYAGSAGAALAALRLLQKWASEDRGGTRARAATGPFPLQVAEFCPFLRCGEGSSSAKLRLHVNAAPRVHGAGHRMEDAGQRPQRVETQDVPQCAGWRNTGWTWNFATA